RYAFLSAAYDTKSTHECHTAYAGTIAIEEKATCSCIIVLYGTPKRYAWKYCNYKAGYNLLRWFDVPGLGFSIFHPLCWVVSSFVYRSDSRLFRTLSSRAPAGVLQRCLLYFLSPTIDDFYRCAVVRRRWRVGFLVLAPMVGA
ncbi:unnamed protein product, partial [Pylaiella littoralis]